MAETETVTIVVTDSARVSSAPTNFSLVVRAAASSDPSSDPPPSTGPANDLYPRIFAYADHAGSQGAWTSTNWTTYAPLYNALVYSGFVGSAPGSGTYTSVMAGIASSSPLPIAPRQGFYIMSTEQSTVGGDGNQSTFTEWSSQVETGTGAGGWWVRDSWPSGTISVNDAKSGLLLLNPNNTGTNSSGRTLFQQFAYHFDNFWALGNADGESSSPPPNGTLSLYFLDNQGPRPDKAGLWGAVSDTTDYAANSATANAYFQEGSALQISALRTQHPGIVIAANTNYWLLYVQGALSGGLVPQRNGIYDYAFAEGVEQWMGDFTAEQLFAGLQAEEIEVSATGTVVVGNYFNGTGGNGVKWTSGAQSTWGTDQWQVARAWNAMAQMRNWTWAPGPGLDNGLYWFDEEYQGGVHGWLSNGTQRLDPPQTGPNGPVTLTGTGNVSGVYVRRFPNGWVLWNPYGNGVVTITNIPTTLLRLTNISSSTGDSTVNTGVHVTNSVTMQDGGDGDGLFLIGTG